MMMKDQIKGLALLLALFAAGWLCAGESELQARLIPETVASGECFELALSSASGEAPELLQMPDFPSQGRSHRSETTMQTTRITVSYRFLAGAPGDYTIGPLPVRLGGKTLRTPALKLKIVNSDAPELPGNDSVFARGFFPDHQRRDYYVGEEIPLFLQVFYPADGSCRLRLSYPEIQIGKSIFRDYRAENPEQPHFARPTESRQRIDGRVFHRIGFQSAFRPLAPGKLKVTADIQSTLLVPRNDRRRDFFDDFFSGNSYRSIPRTLTVEFPEITVHSLPVAPEGVLFTGLVGAYGGEVTLSQDKVEAREPLTLTLELRGDAAAESLKAPELHLPDCRVYPPEIVREPGRIQIRYVVIPLQSGTLPLRVVFAAFDPASGRYSEWKLDKSLVVTPSARPVAAAADDYAAQRRGLREKSSENPEHSTLLYCKSAPYGTVRTDWPGGQGVWVWLLAAAGPLFFAAHEWLVRRRSRLDRDPERRRRSRAEAHRKELARRIRTIPAAELPQLITGEVTGYLCDRWGLPPGATPEQAAEAADDPELADVLRRAGELSYLPAEAARETLQKEGPELRKVLLRSVKLALFLMLSGVPLTGAEAVGAPVGEPVGWEDALSAYDRGEYPRAEAFFVKQLRERGDDPHVLYNLGCIKAAENEPGQALCYLERASLLKPGDSAALENRNLLRRKFFLPEKGGGKTPWELLSSLRDRLRPDHYLVLGALFWLMFWVALSFRRRLGHSLNWLLRVGLPAGMLLSLLAFFTQLQSTYRDGQGWVVAKSVDLSSLPGHHNGRRIGVLTEGTPVRILEERREYTHIAGGDMEGWVPSSAVGKVL